MTLVICPNYFTAKNFVGIQVFCPEWPINDWLQPWNPHRLNFCSIFSPFESTLGDGASIIWVWANLSHNQLVPRFYLRRSPFLVRPRNVLTSLKKPQFFLLSLFIIFSGSTNLSMSVWLVHLQLLGVFFGLMIFGRQVFVVIGLYHWKYFTSNFFGVRFLTFVPLALL